jgi:Ulp1 family protease
MNHGHENPEMEGRYKYEGVRTWFNNRFGEEKKVSDMSTVVMFQNQNRMHWVCYGIFLEKKFIQEFDSMGGGDVEALQDVYHCLAT